MNATKNETVEEILSWFENNPGGNDWLIAILRDGERGIDAETHQHKTVDPEQPK